jgi:ankyrin repeat protein
MGMVLAAYIPLSLAQDSGEATAPAKKIPPICLAEKQGNLAAVRSLIVQGKDVNAVNAAGRSALMSAVFFSNRGIVKVLITEVANVNGTDSLGRTARMIAVIKNDMKMIYLLLGAGAALEDKTKNTEITLAERSKKTKI